MTVLPLHMSFVTQVVPRIVAELCRPTDLKRPCACPNRRLRLRRDGAALSPAAGVAGAGSTEHVPSRPAAGGVPPPATRRPRPGERPRRVRPPAPPAAVARP